MRYAFILGMMIGILTSAGQASGLITHDKTADSVFDLDQCEQALRQKQSTILPVEEEIEYLHELVKFKLGLDLLQNKGLNGYWTSYVILYGPERQDLLAVEYWILWCAPAIIATRERFEIFQNILQNNLKDNIKMASIPCGTMDDLLRLDYTNIKNSHLTGIDLDPESLTLAQANATQHHLSGVDFAKKDAWNLDYDQEFDVITSNGLNIYEPDDGKVIDLYKGFHRALKPGGKLVTSFLTPPPSPSKKSSWTNVDPKNAQIQMALFIDIIGIKWQAFRDEKLTRDQLAKAGFDVLQVIYDNQGIFPTVVAQKR